MVATLARVYGRHTYVGHVMSMAFMLAGGFFLVVAPAYALTRNGTVPYAESTKFLTAYDTLRVRVAVRYAMGGPQPIAHTRFFLLEENPDKVIADLLGIEDAPIETEGEGRGGSNPFAPIQPRGVAKVGRVTPMDAYVAVCAARSYPCIEARDTLLRASIQSGETDLDGMAVFEGIEPGVYYVYGRGGLRGGGWMYWSQRVEVPRGRALELSDANAVGAIE